MYLLTVMYTTLAIKLKWDPVETLSVSLICVSLGWTAVLLFESVVKQHEKLTLLPFRVEIRTSFKQGLVFVISIDLVLPLTGLFSTLNVVDES